MIAAKSRPALVIAKQALNLIEPTDPVENTALSRVSRSKCICTRTARRPATLSSSDKGKTAKF